MFGRFHLEPFSRQVDCVVNRRADRLEKGEGLKRALVVGLSMLTGTVYAQPSAPNGVRLSFVRAENASGCMTASALEREVVQRMGHDPFDGEARQWIEGFVETQAGYFEVQLFERDAEGKTLGTRRLREHAADCHKLDDAIVLAIALIIDPTAVLAPAARSVATAATAPPRDTSVPAVTATSTAPRREAVPTTAPLASLAPAPVPNQQQYKHPHPRAHTQWLSGWIPS
jgi:hypothetical protein